MDGYRRARVGLALDLVITVLGSIVGLVALVATATSPAPFPWGFLLCIPVVIAANRFPMTLRSSAGSRTLQFSPGVLVFLFGMVDAWSALAIWWVAEVAEALVQGLRVRDRAFMAGLHTLAAGLAAGTFVAVRGSASTTPRELFAVALACVTYFLVDEGLASISLALEEGVSFVGELVRPSTVSTLAIFLAFNSLGYHAVLVLRELPLWSSFFLVVPLGTILVLARVRSRGHELARRVQVLFDTAASMRAATETTEIIEILKASARDLMRDPRAAVRRTGPGRHEIGVDVSGWDDRLWIISRTGSSSRSNESGNRKAMEALAAVTVEALERLRLTQQTVHLASHDPLTGLTNRAFFIDRVDRALAGQRGSDVPTLLFCDLDGFKSVNDQFGHAAGDELLVEVARRFATSVRSCDVVARLGGDEFAVLLEGTQDASDADAACERLLAALRPRIEVAGHEISLSTSIGVAFASGDTSSATLLRNADLAMYHAKARGKGRYEVYQADLDEHRMRHLELVEALRRAVELRQLEMHYQPVVDLRTREVLGVEALARWHHDGKPVPPSVFIRAAEESGIIVALGDLVFDLVAEDAGALAEAAGRPLAVHVNVSAQQLRGPRLVDQVRRVQEQAGDVDLILELTERDFVGDDTEAVDTMMMLAANGVRFAIDDFGVGFSSIGYLQRLPVAMLKIDRSFVDKVTDSAEACSLVRLMTLMGHGLGIDVVVEGIERADQLEHLVEHDGVSAGQGWLLGRPLPLRQAVARLSGDAASVQAANQHLLCQ